MNFTTLNTVSAYPYAYIDKYMPNWFARQRAFFIF